MRLPLIVAAVAFSFSAFAADTNRPSNLACDQKKIGARELADCLRTAADKSDRELSAMIEAAAKVVDAKQGLQTPQKNRWKRSLNDSQALWVRYRDAECQDVSPFEEGLNKGGDPRLSCIIDRNARRAEELRARYN